MPGVTYLLQFKSAPGQDPAALPDDLDPAAAQDGTEDHEWAGDLYEEGDESDPVDAFAALRASDGSEAWLDRADDGTLTGWVRDVDGTVYRYSDPDAWALDVDGAGMTSTDGEATGDELDPEADPNADQQQDPALDETNAVDDPNADPNADDPALDDPNADEADPDLTADYLTDGVPGDDGTTDDTTDDDPNNEDVFTKFRKKGGQGKSYDVVVTPKGTHG